MAIAVTIMIPGLGEAEIRDGSWRSPDMGLASHLNKHFPADRLFWRESYIPSIERFIASKVSDLLGARIISIEETDEGGIGLVF